MKITLDAGDDPIEIATRHDGRIVLTRRTSSCCGQALHIDMEPTTAQLIADGLNDLIDGIGDE